MVHFLLTDNTLRFKLENEEIIGIIPKSIKITTKTSHIHLSFFSQFFSISSFHTHSWVSKSGEEEKIESRVNPPPCPSAMNNLLSSLNTLSKTITTPKPTTADTTVVTTNNTVDDSDNSSEDIESRLLLEDIRNENGVLRKENFRLLKQLDLLKGISQEIDHLKVQRNILTHSDNSYSFTHKGAQPASTGNRKRSNKDFRWQWEDNNKAATRIGDYPTHEDQD